MPINFSNVFYTYSINSPMQFAALKDINLTIDDGTFTAIIGHTGSGKSTLVQHINALLRANKGILTVGDHVIDPKEKKVKKLKDLRKYAGLVFQFPEYQLFEETVIKDVAFGPKNFGIDEATSIEKAKVALTKVGLGEDTYGKSPFELSGGQRRRVAIAGIIALEPKILILDEPTAGLDPQGAKEMMELFLSIYHDGTTIIMVTHDMDNVINYATRAIVMSQGEIVKEVAPVELFKDNNLLDTMSIEEPKAIAFAKKLIHKGLNLNLNNIKDVKSLAIEIKNRRNEK